MKLTSRGRGNSVRSITTEIVNTIRDSDGVGVYTNEQAVRLERDYMTGFDIDNYHARKRRGELLPMTPFTHIRETGTKKGRWLRKCSSVCWDAHLDTNDSGHGILTSDALWDIPEGDIWGYATDDPGKLVQSAAAAIYSNGFDAGTFLAELGSTRRMFSNAAKRLRSILSSNRRQDLLKENASDLWLEARYGWRPFLSEMISLSNALDNLGGERKRFSQRVGYSKANVEVSTLAKDHGAGVATWTSTVMTNVSYRGAVVADIEVPSFRFNPLTTAWEVIPLSFVIDWFVNVGNSLEAMSFLLLSSQHTASYGLEIQASVSSSVTSVSPYSYIASHDHYQDWQFDAHYKKRWPSAVSGTPQLQLNLDSFKIADVLALIRQRVR